MPITDIVVAVPRLKINGIQAEFTSGLVIDHLARRVRGAIPVQEGDPLPGLLRRLRKGRWFRKGDRVQLEFISYIDAQQQSVEYSGSAEAIMIRVRPRRRDMYKITFAFRLFD